MFPSRVGFSRHDISPLFDTCILAAVEAWIDETLDIVPQAQYPSMDEPGGRNLDILWQQESQNILARASACLFPSRFYTTANGAKMQYLSKLLFESA